MTADAGQVLKNLHKEFGHEVEFVTVYVREAHPGDRYPHPETMEQKMQHAKDYKERDDIPWPVAVDDIDGSFHNALDPKPSAVYLMDGAGNVAFRLLWSNDEPVVRDGLKKLLAGRHPIQEKNNRLRPMLRGTGVMHQVLSMAGPQARRDVMTAAPPMYFMAWLAGLFRPLSPLSRTLAAMGVLVLLFAGLVGLVWWLVSLVA